MNARSPLPSMSASAPAVAAAGPDGSAASPALYDAWLGLVPQFFAQLGLPASSGAQAPVEAASNGAEAPHAAPADRTEESDPLASIARAATLTMSSLQDLQRVYTPMLQVAGGPGLLGHLAAALAAADPSIPAHPHAGHPGAMPGTAAGPAALQVWADGFDRTFGAVSDAIGLAPARRLQRAVQGLVAATVADTEARAAYGAQLQVAFAKGFERLLERLAQTAASGGRVDGMLDLMKAWAACSEEAAHEVLQSEAGLAATAALSRASVAKRGTLQELAAVVSGSLDLATRRELDEAFREIQQLKREVRRLRAAIPVPSDAPPTATRAASTRPRRART